MPNCKHCGEHFERYFHAFGHWDVKPCRTLAAKEAEAKREPGEPPPMWP